MKIYKNANDTMRVGCEERNGEYVIIIQKYFKRLVATKGSKKAHQEYDFSDYEKNSKIKKMLINTS